MADAPLEDRCDSAYDAGYPDILNVEFRGSYRAYHALKTGERFLRISAGIILLTAAYVMNVTLTRPVIESTSDIVEVVDDDSFRHTNQKAMLFFSAGLIVAVAMPRLTYSKRK